MIFVSLLAGAIVGALAFVDSAAAAQKKISREEAWQKCKALLDKEKTPSQVTTNDRYLRGGACMHMYGYNL